MRGYLRLRRGFVSATSVQSIVNLHSYPAYLRLRRGFVSATCVQTGPYGIA